MAEKMRIDSEMLSPKQKHAVILLARGATVSQAAEASGVSEATIYNWKADDRFNEDLKDEARCYVDEIRLTLSGFMTPAMERLRTLIDSEDPNIALKAIDRVLKATGFNDFDPQRYVFRHLGLETELYEDNERERRAKSMCDLGW